MFLYVNIFEQILLIVSIYVKIETRLNGDVNKTSPF